MKFGIIRKEKEEEKLLFDFPYLVMEAKPEDSKKEHKFWLKGENIKELLELNERDNLLSWIFNENNNSFYLVNITSLEDKVDPSMNLSMEMKFSNKKLYEKIENLTGINPMEDNFFMLSKVLGGIYDLPAVEILPTLSPAQLHLEEEGTDELLKASSDIEEVQVAESII